MNEQATSENTFGDTEIDSAYDQAFGDNPPIDAQPEPQAQPTPAAATEPVIKFSHKGKEISVPMSDKRVQQWIQQGYDYSNLTGEFSKTREQFESERKQIEAMKNQYGPVDEWVKQNPEAWQRIVQQFQAQQSGQAIDPNNPLTQHLQTLEQRLGSLEPALKEILSERQAQQQKAEDAALDTEIKSIQEQYPDLDLNKVGDDGRSLVFKVLEHANKNRIPSFRAAFLDLNHADLLKRAEERGKESVLKERQKQTKLGLLGKSSTPGRPLTDAKNYKEKSYDQLIAEGLDELGLSS